MKQMKPLIFAVIIITFYSCTSNSEKTLKNDSVERNIAITQFQDSIQKVNDSVRKVEEFAIAQLKKDSIEDSQIKRYSVEKISGKHKYGGATKIQYKSLFQLLSEIEKKAKKEMWTYEEKKSKIDAYKSFYKGGEIRLDIERTTLGAANTKYFSIIIKDLDENELYRKDLDSNIPETPKSNDYWWNISIEGIDKRIRAPFYVYVVDKLEDAPFKFEVTPVKN
ncbi:MAG: hypothetical protein COA32_01540 [Fluviicola sp.]|nr:MAG: hypothetical protein COA32_01540 [Fluviicola sp.]